ncbi:MAG TPA: MerR family transcriptional regulator, partial [Bacillota bacterium]|nr:MerR family transcriptional regulator [Bacillota bacterium]
MKIGEFANKFGLNASTVRYYINNGLLVPAKKAEQYEFDRDSEEDMKNILKYKSYHFTIEEIQLLFFLQKTSRFKDDVVLGLCSDLLKKKRKELMAEKKEMEAHILSLENEIEGMPKTVSPKETKTGIPFSFIPYLYCPVCKEPLKLDSASMAEGTLLSGELWCECGYNAGIKEGMILCGKHYEDTPFKAFENIESVMAMVDQFSPAYRKLIDQTNLYMYNQIHEDLENPKIIMTGPFTLNFLLAYIDKLNKKNTYIISDPSKKRLEKIK